VPQGSIIGPLIYNIILNGLENYLLHPLSYQYSCNFKEIKHISKIFKNTKMQHYNYFHKYFETKIKIY
jgi:hypothetical protein